MKPQEIEQKVRESVSEIYGVPLDQVTLNSFLKEDLGGDSLDMVELVLAMEDEFDLVTDEEEIGEDFKTVGDVVKFLQERLSD